MRNIIMGIYQAMKNAFIVVATHTLTLKGQLQGNLRQTDIDNPHRLPSEYCFVQFMVA